MWCPAKASCAALAEISLNPAQDSFLSHDRRMTLAMAAGPINVPDVALATIDNPKPTVAAGGVVLPQITALDPGDISTLLDRFEFYDLFKKAVQQRAADLTAAGVIVPGWVLESRTGNRVFKEPDEIPPAFANLGAASKDIQSLLRVLGLKTSDMFADPKMLSPAQMEKKVPKAVRNLLDLLITRPMGESTLVRASAGKVSTPHAVPGNVGPISTIEQKLV
jgi:hypothetical protein